MILFEVNLIKLLIFIKELLKKECYVKIFKMRFSHFPWEYEGV